MSNQCHKSIKIHLVLALCMTEILPTIIAMLSFDNAMLSFNGQTMLPEYHEISMQKSIARWLELCMTSTSFLSMVTCTTLTVMQIFPALKFYGVWVRVV